jgi:hypothetical protein
MLSAHGLSWRISPRDVSPVNCGADIVFDYFGSDTEIACEDLLGSDVAFDCVARLLRNEKLPSELNWVQD